MLAEITLIGYIGNTPDIKEGDDGRKYASLRVATDFYKKVNDTFDSYTMWHTVFINDKFMVEKASNLQKGDMIYAHGPMRYSKYTDADGVLNVMPYCSADKLKILKKGKLHEEKDIEERRVEDEKKQNKTKALFVDETPRISENELPFMNMSYDEELPF